MRKSTGYVESRYTKLSSVRDVYLDRARKCAKITIPALFMEQGHTPSSTIKTPWQSLGARGVNNLASKLVLALMPVQQPFFRFLVDDKVFREENNPEARADVERALSKAERIVMQDVDESGDRVVAWEAFKHLIVAGNVLLYEDPDEGLRMIPMERFAVKRDPSGKVLEIIVKETMSPASLPEDLRNKISLPSDSLKDSLEETINVFTYVKREPDRYVVYQECKGKKIPGTAGHYPLDVCPWYPLRFARIDGEDYGRSYVEEYLGDLKTLEGLNQALTEGAVGGAKLLWLCKPNGTTDPKMLAEAENGDFVEGDVNEVAALQVQKTYDFQTAHQRAQVVEERLSFAFLLNTSIQRNAERVTAEEIRYMAGELEDALGGLYSILTQEFQLPYVKRKILKLEKAKKLPVMPKDVVHPTIITGLEAIGRGHDRTKLVGFMQTLGQTVGYEIAAQYINVSNLIKRLAASDGIDTDGLVRTEQELAGQEQQNMQMGLVNRLGPEAVKQIGNLSVAHLKNQQQGAPQNG